MDIWKLVEDVLAAGRSPEEACANCPELLPDLLQRLERMRRIESQINEVFPSSGIDSNSTETPPRLSHSELPQIDGYDVERILGRGGMGVVYRAKHQKLNRLVALKMLLAGPYASPQAVARFVRESQAVAELHHPHIVQVHDVGEVDGRPFFTMEFVEGKTLAEDLAGVPQPARRAAELIAVLAEAIHLVHTKGIIHRDLKPANILLTEEGVPKIADFGLARHVEGDPQLTMSDARVGTPSYMAPEQALGKLGIVGPPVDIYALGAILYEMLTGRPPFRAETAIETERQAITVEAAPPSRLNVNVPRDLETICLKCLQKDPHRRYGSAAELANDLHHFLNGQPILARPVGIIERSWRWAARNRPVAAALAGVVALLVLIVVGSLWDAAHFRKLEGEHRILAQEKTELADQKGRLLVEKEGERAKAVLAENRETGLRRKSESLRQELRSNLYLTEMNLAGQAASTPSGLNRVRELLAHWDQQRPDLRNWEWYYLNSLCNQSLLTRMPHTQGVYHVAWSPDGQRLASASLDRSICILDESGERPPVRLSGHTSLVFSVSWSPDGQRLASASWDHSVRIWDTISGAEVFRFPGHSDDVCAVSWSPDGRLIASSGRDRVVKIWSATDGTVHKVLSGHEQTVTALSWHKDSRHLASASHDWTVRIWDVMEGVETHALRGHINWVNHVAWNPDGTRLASASNDETLRIWNPENGETEQILRGHVQGVSSVSWSPDGTRLASGSDDQTIKVWVAATGTAAFSLRGHSAALTSVAWNPNGARIASAGHDAAIKLWDAAPPAEVQGPANHDEPVRALAWCQNNSNLFASADSIGAVKIWDVTHREVKRSLRVNEARIYSLSWQPSGTRLAIAGANGVVRIWDLAAETKPLDLDGHKKDVYSVAWSPNGRRIASGSADKTIRIWDAASGRVSQVIENHDHYVLSVAWSPDSRKLASASGDSTVRIWDFGSGKEAFCYRGHQSQVVSVAWSPDGTKIASAGFDLTVHVWDPATGEAPSILHGHTTHIARVAWSPDGSRLASVGRDGTLKVWDVATGKEALTLTGHVGQVNAVVWSEDGAALISAGEDRQIRLHDATKGYFAARARQLLTTIDQRLNDDPSRPADWKLRAEVDARQREWTSAAQDAQKYLSKDPRSTWFIPDCWVAGPYPQDFSRSCLPEQVGFFDSEELEQTVEISKVNWQTENNNDHDIIDLGSVVDRRTNVSAYALFPVYSIRTQQVAILLGSTDQARLWCNGDLLHESLRPRDATPEEDAIPATLKPGWNALLVRVASGTGSHALYFRLSNSESDLARVRTTSP
jgi:WD40 repeat protein/predicted Ser/Thr protein kinase